MVNGMSVNGLGEVSMDTNQAVINPTLLALGNSIGNSYEHLFF